jgi:hypothetical protein
VFGLVRLLMLSVRPGEAFDELLTNLTDGK